MTGSFRSVPPVSRRNRTEPVRYRWQTRRMAETTERVLSLLGLLQQRPVWTGPELAERLGVTTRSVRRDVERLRGLGYPVLATQGVGGGYQLGRGRALPPLLLDDAEAVAVAVSLRMAAGGTVSGASEAALRTLAKLDQVMPPRLRGEVRAIHEATQTLDQGSGHRRRRRAPAAGAGVPRPGPGAVRLRGPRRYAELPHRRAGRAGRHRPAVVPDGLRRRPRGLAHVPARPAAGGRADHVALPRA